MREEGRGEGRGDDEAGMAGGEAVRLRRTASLGRLLKMRDESLREEILGLCWMGGQMSCAEQCNMGSRGRGRGGRRDQTRPAVSLREPMFMHRRAARRRDGENRRKREKK